MNRIHADVQVRRFTPADKNFFFGYYDKCPWNQTGDRMIAGMTSVSGRQPERNDALIIGVLDPARDDAFQPLGDTQAWNFQQGAMAQWLYLDGRELILFNTRKGNQAHARLIDPTGQQIRDFDLPVYAVSPHGRLAVSVDFGRLARLRPGYGYTGVSTTHTAEPAPSQDGLTLIDLQTGTSRLLVSYAELAAQVMPRGRDAPHWVDHIEFGPDSQTVVFLHRWLAPDGGPLTRVIAVDAESGSLYGLLDCGAAGHGLWLNEHKYGIWGRKGTIAATARATTSGRTAPLRFAVRLARSLIPPVLKSRIHQESFLVLNVRESSVETALPQIPHGLRGGHPSLHPDGRWVVSDTLPDAKGRRLLFLASLDGQQKIPLVTFMHEASSANSPYRCDFHPRWDRCGQSVCIDSLHEGFRGMYGIDVSKVFP